MDPAVDPPSGDDFADRDDIQPISWADSIGDEEFEALDVVIPSWAVLDPPTVKAKDPYASRPVQRRAENQSFFRREFRQKTEYEVWRKPAPSSSWRRSPPSGFFKRPERPVREASQTQRRFPPAGNFHRQERRVREASPTRRRSPPSCHRQECRVRDAPPAQQRSPPSGFFKRSERTEVEASPQTPCSGFFNRQKSPVKEASPQSVEKAPPSGSLKKKRPSLALYIPPKFRPPTSGSHPSGDFKRPDPAVTEAPPLQPQVPTTNGVSSRDGQNTTPAKSVARKQEMGGPEMSSIAPTTNTPAPVSEHTFLPSGTLEKLRAPLTQAPPLHHRLPPPGFFKRPDPPVAKASSQHPVSSISSSSTVNGVRPQEALPLTQGVMRPKALLRPATFVFKEQPTVDFAQHQTVAGLKTRTKPPAPPTPEPADEHLPAPYPNPRPCLLGKKICRKRWRPSSDS